jgi:hypothetical protein
VALALIAIACTDSGVVGTACDPRCGAGQVCDPTSGTCVAPSDGGSMTCSDGGCTRCDDGGSCDEPDECDDCADTDARCIALYCRSCDRDTDCRRDELCASGRCIELDE